MTTLSTVIRTRTNQGRKWMKRYTVMVGGSKPARKRWKTRTYKLLSSAKRRLRAIKEAKDSGVSTVWILTEEVSTYCYEGQAKKVFQKAKEKPNDQ
jgi:hypothetical protein